MATRRPQEGAKAKFCKSLPWTISIEWLDLTGFARLDDERLVRIELAINGVVGEYAGFRVQIRSKRLGLLDEKLFLFRDFMDALDRSQRADDRSYDGHFSVVSHVGWTWYIAVPKHPRDFTAAVERYIALWK